MHTTKLTIEFNLCHDGLSCAECERRTIVENVMLHLREYYDVEQEPTMGPPADLPDPLTYTWDGVPIYLTKISEVKA